jgi:nicotinate phosphoribosyltransferase
LTDLYQLTMMAGYFAAGHPHDRAVFEMFVRRLPKGRSYLVFAGLEQTIGDLLRLRFSNEQVDAIRALPAFKSTDPIFFEHLSRMRFAGDVWSVAEGTVVFAGEPLLRVEGSLAEAQWVETFLLTSIGYPTLVATKAARVVEAAGGRPVFDFGLRRGHGAHAGMLAARASYLAGCSGTSNLEAALRLEIPCAGTMAHSWVQSFSDERDAFESFARAFPSASTLLVDTYDTEAGVRLAATIEPAVEAIRIDSGDLLYLSRRARVILDENDRTETRIVASGDLDEFSIASLVAAGAPIDAFGVGTEMVTSRDAPALSLVYKLVELNGEGKFKLSPGKKSYPLGKQVRRFRDEYGLFSHDLVTMAGEPGGGEPLLNRVVERGRLSQPLPDLTSIRSHCREQLEALPETMRGVNSSSVYRMEYSEILEREAERLRVK